MTTTGTLTAEADEAATLQHDLFCILLRFHREQGLRSLRSDVTRDELAADSERMALELGSAIGGRYVRKMRDERAEALEARNCAIFAAWNGRNRDELIRQFKISRRAFYRVIAEHTRRAQRQT